MNIFANKYKKYIEPLIIARDLASFTELIKGNLPFLNQPSIDFLKWILKYKNLPDTFKKLTLDQIDKYKKEVNNRAIAFLNMKDINDLLNYFGTNWTYLHYYLYELADDQRYDEFKIKKKRGGFRTISAPIFYLKSLQEKLNESLQIHYQHKVAVHGFIPGRSIKTNASKHLKKNNVLNVDIKNFYPTINFGRVRGLYLNKPFNFNEKIATLLAQVCCASNQLPQGAPSSPIISNYICGRLDHKLLKLAKLNYCTYTRYADDITFSNNRYNLPENIIEEIRRILNEEGFEVNEDKIRTQTKSIRQSVTGLTTNVKVNINRKYIRKVRAILHSWKTEQYQTASNKYAQSVKCNNKLIKPDMSKSILGKIEFIGYIRGKDDRIYKSLLDKYRELSKDTKFITYSISKNVTEEHQEELQSERRKKYGSKSKEYDKRLKHDTLKFIKAISLFSNPDASLRNLVHKQADNSTYNLPLILKHARKEYNSIKIYLPSFMRSRIKDELFELYRKVGIDIWINNNACPIDIDESFYTKIQSFKRKYRFGKANIEETNMLYAVQHLLTEKGLSKMIGKVVIDDKIENLNTYTDVDAIIIAIRKFLSMCPRFSIDNDYQIDIKYVKEKKAKIIEIAHKNSMPSILIEDFKSKIESGNSELGELRDVTLKTRCDWQIEADFLNGRYKIDMLHSFNESRELIIESKGPVNMPNTFTHKLIFI